MGQWTSTQYPLEDINPNAHPISVQGSYVSACSHDGQLLAIAVNQHNSHLNRIVFFAPKVETLVVSDMKGSGAKTPVIRTSRYLFFLSCYSPPGL